MAELGSAEKDLLVGTLGAQRRHVLGILDGLSADELLCPVLPSGWSCASLVHHLAVDVERFWFRAVVAGEEVDLDDGWQVEEGTDPADVLATYRAEIELADAIVSRRSLDDPPVWWPEELFGSWRLEDLREILVHVVVETATHAGHLDAARELLDGRQWLVLGGEG